MPPTPAAEKPKGSAGPKIEYRHNIARGEHEIGVRANGLFVSFVSLSDARHAQLVENAANIAANAADENGKDES
jgi:hypothetical protein